jgi:hypothetical protein
MATSTPISSVIIETVPEAGEGAPSTRSVTPLMGAPILDADEVKKNTLAEGLEKPEPVLSLSAGPLRGEMNKSGFTMRTTDTDVAGDAPDNGAELLVAERADRFNDDDGLMTKPAPLPEMKFPVWVSYVQAGAMILSVMWIAVAIAMMVGKMGMGLLAMAPHELGGMLAGVLAPVALLWLALTHITRTYDAQRYGEALRAELHALIFPSEDRQQRISHDIEKLCQQAAELAGSSRTVLRAVQKSRQMLQQEARDFLLLSRKAEGHIDQLAGNLHDRALKLGEVTIDIERRTAAIDANTKEGVKVWDDTAAHILAKASEIETALGRGANKILGAADTAQGKAGDIEVQLNKTFDRLSVSIDDVAGRMDKLSSEFDTHGTNLSRTSEKVIDETSRLGLIIQSQIADLEGMSSGVFEAVAKSSAMVKEQRETLDAGAQALVRQADDIVGKIKGSAELLETVSTDVAVRTGDVETRIVRQTDGLRRVLEHLESQTRTVEQTGDGLAERLSEALSVALSGSETLATTMRRAVESLQNAASESRTQAADIVRLTTSSIDNLQETGSAQVTRAEQLAVQLATHRDMLMENARKAEEQARTVIKLYDEQAVSMSVAIVGMTEKLTAASVNLTMPLRAIDTAVTEADRRHEVIEQTLTRRVDDLNRASTKAVDAAEQIQTMLRTQAQDMSILSGQMSGQVRSISDQIGQQKDMLGTQVERTVQDLDRVRTAIERQSETMQHVASEMNTDLARLHDRMADRTTTLRQDAEGLTARLYDLDEKMSASTANLVDHTSRLRDTADVAASTLDKSIEHAEPIYRRLQDQAVSTQERFELLHRTFDTSSSSSLERLQQIGIVFDDRLSQLRAGVQEAAQILRTSGDDLRTRVDDIENASVSASDRMNNVSKTLNNQITDIHLLTDQALLKVENVQKAIESQFHELNVAVGKAVAELEGAQDEFTGAAKTLDSSVETSVRKVQAAARETIGESNVLQAAAASVVKTTQDLIANLQTEAKAMLQSAGDSLMEIKKISDGFSMRAHEVEEHMKSSLSTAQTYGRDMKSQAGMIAETTVDTADKISRAITLMNGKIVEVERAAMAVGEKVEQVRSKLEGEAGKFMSTAKQAVEAAEDASSAYARQSNVLFKAAQEAVAQIDKIKDVQGRTQRDAFLSSAKFVIESLHSLSVDFVRVLEGNVDDKTWRAFQKGDVAAFTRRLVQNMDQVPQDKVRAKFAGDSEFRGYVQRYLRQFEDMFDQAVANDHGELLVATFLSSDVGRLYQALCVITGREAKVGRDLAKAA